MGVSVKPPKVKLVAGHLGTAQFKRTPSLVAAHFGGWITAPLNFWGRYVFFIKCSSLPKKGRLFSWAATFQERVWLYFHAWVPSNKPWPVFGVTESALLEPFGSKWLYLKPTVTYKSKGESFSILFNHRSFQPDPFPGLSGLPERIRIPGFRNGRHYLESP